MKKAGIVCDNYKIKAFKKELDKEGFDYEIFVMSGHLKGMSTIQVIFDPATQLMKVKALCERVEHISKNKN